MSAALAADLSTAKLTDAELRDLRLRAERGWPTTPETVARLASALEDAIDKANGAKSVTIHVHDADELVEAFDSADASLKEAEAVDEEAEKEHAEVVEALEKKAKDLESERDDLAESADELRKRAELAEAEVEEKKRELAETTTRAEAAEHLLFLFRQKNPMRRRT